MGVSESKFRFEILHIAYIIYFGHMEGSEISLLRYAMNLIVVHVVYFRRR